MDNCFIKSNVDFIAASGWLERLVRPGGFIGEDRLATAEILKVR
jgi:hypothetical protein